MKHLYVIFFLFFVSGTDQLQRNPTNWCKYVFGLWGAGMSIDHFVSRDKNFNIFYIPFTNWYVYV